MAQEWAKKLYDSKEWEQCCEGFMDSKFFICERCFNPAIICHHKIYLSKDNINDPFVALNWGNLEGLCLECHNDEHHRNGEKTESVMFYVSPFRS